MPATTTRLKQATALRQAGLVEAALALAAQRSPADITTADLAQTVGISQGAVFRHFASKEAIWLAVLDWATETLLGELRAATSEPLAQSTPLAALQGVFRAHVDFVVRHPGVPRVIFQELQHAQDTLLKAGVRRLMQQYRALLSDILTRAQAQGLLAPGIDLSSAAVLFMGSVQGLVMQSMLSGNVHAMQAQAPGVFSIYLRGITSRPSP